MPAKMIDPIDPIVQRLRALAESSPELTESARLYEIILPILRDADLHAESIPMTAEQAHVQLEHGLPLLHDADLAFDDEAARDLLIRLARALESDSVGPSRSSSPRRSDTQPDATELYERAHAGDDAALRASAAGQIRLALKRGELPVGELLSRVASGDSTFAMSLAQSRQLDAGLLWTLAQNALKPALRACCRQLSPLAQGFDWRKGYCFICGSPATLGELQENDAVKHLRCGQCGADWSSRRLQCMYCGNDDHTTLSFFYPDGQREKSRIQVCDRCGGYLKVIAAFSPTPADRLPIEDLATLHLDFIAQSRGYARVALQ